MKLLRIAAMFIATVYSSVAFADTECSDFVSEVVSEQAKGGMQVSVKMLGGTSFVFKIADGPRPNAFLLSIYAVLQSSQFSGAPLAVRFAESGLTCATAVGREDLVSVRQGYARTETTTTMPAQDAASAAPQPTFKGR